MTRNILYIIFTLATFISCKDDPYKNLYEELKKQMPEYLFEYLDLPDYRDHNEWW